MKHNIEVVNMYTHEVTPHDIYVGRRSALGNPFSLDIYGPSRAEVIKLYNVWLQEKLQANDAAVCDQLNHIASEVAAGHPVKLVCYCKPHDCHADLIRKLILKELKK